VLDPISLVTVSFITLRPPPTSTLFPYTTLFRSIKVLVIRDTYMMPKDLSLCLASGRDCTIKLAEVYVKDPQKTAYAMLARKHQSDRKSTRLNSSHVKISYAVFCLKKKNPNRKPH